MKQRSRSSIRWDRVNERNGAERFHIVQQHRGLIGPTINTNFSNQFSVECSGEQQGKCDK